MNDGSQWDVPIFIIIKHRAKSLLRLGKAKNQSVAIEDGYDCLRSRDGQKEILDYAQANITWKDIDKYAERVNRAFKIDLQTGWVLGRKTIIDRVVN